MKLAPAIFAILCMVASSSALAQSSYTTGERFFRAENFVAAQREWTEAARNGDREAQYMLGQALSAGRYFPIDKESGLAYLKQASANGHAKASYALYRFQVLNQAGTPVETQRLLETAAAQGHLVAKWQLENAGQDTGYDDAVTDLGQLVPVRVTPLAQEERGAASVRGQEIFQKSCIGCHGPGVMNAPKPGDRPRWNKLNKKGFDVLVQNAIKGHNGHPARGGDFSLSGNDIRNAVLYMSTAAALAGRGAR